MAGASFSPPRPGWRDLAGRCWPARPPAANAANQPGTAPATAGNLTDDSELRHTERGIARAMFRVAVSGRRDQEASFFT